MKLFLITLCSIIVFGSYPAKANVHGWSGSPSGKFWNDWALTVNLGLTSFYGDLSIYDNELLKKMQLESKPAFGFLITKYFTRGLGISGQFLYGGLKGSNNQGISFNTSLIEYNAQLRLDLLNLFVKRNNTGLGIIAFGGIGHMIFQTDKVIYVGEQVNSYSHQAKTPEFVYFAGAGLEYVISERFNIGIDAGFRQGQNDRLDNEVVNSDFDYYSYISVGLTYFFGRNFKYSKNKNLNRSGVKMAFR